MSMRPALNTILVGAIVLVWFVGALLFVTGPSYPLHSEGEGMFLRCHPRHGYTPPSDCPP